MLQRRGRPSDRGSGLQRRARPAYWGTVTGRATISVIIPAFEAEDLVDSALASVAAQTRPADEVILIDDASTDSTVERAMAWTPRLPLRVICLEQNMGGRLGAGGPRSVAIAASSSDLVALLDVDDVWSADHLEVMEHTHAQDPGGLVAANNVLWVPGRALGRHDAAVLVPVPSADRQAQAILDENFVFVGTLFSRHLYERAGGFRSTPCEDWDLWIRMIATGARVTMPSTVTVHYRQSEHSVSSGDRILTGEIALLDRLAVERVGDERRVVLRALRRRRARVSYLDGIDHTLAGDLSAARRAFWRAVTTDPSLRRSNSRHSGSVVLRAAACMVAPRRMVAVRQRRQSDPAFMVGDRAVARWRARRPIDGSLSAAARSRDG